MGTTPTSRRSRRLAGVAPAAKIRPSRKRQPNTHTLDAFCKKQAQKQSSIRLRGTGNRKISRNSELPNSGKSPKDVPTTPIEILTSPGAPSQSSPYLTPAPARKRATAPPPSSPFNPNDEGKLPHNVSIIITPIMDGSRKGDASICLNIDINNTFRVGLQKLQDIVYSKYVRNWAEVRKLTPAEKPRFDHLQVVIGNPKGHSRRFKVDDDDSWRNVEITLRQIEKDGGANRKNAHYLEVDAVYRSFDRSITPPVENSSQAKDSKARPGTARITRLGATPEGEDGTSEAEMDEDEEEEEDSQDLDLPPVLKVRDSITNRQLKAKRAHDRALPRTSYYRGRIFATHQCRRDGCEGEKGACYHLKSSDSHHKLVAKDLDEWAQLIGVDEEVTLQLPPPHLIIKYMGGYQLMKNKRRSRKGPEEKKNDVTKEETPAPVNPTATIPLAQAPIQYPYPAQPAILPPPFYQLPPYPAPQYPQPPYHATPRYYDPEYDHWAPLPRSRRPAYPPPPPSRPKVPSSPIRDPTNEVLAGLKAYMVERAENPEQVDHIDRGIQTMKELGFRVEHLQANFTIQKLLDEGVNLDTILLLQGYGKDFKAMWQERRAAAEGLLKVQQAPFQPGEMGGSIASFTRQQFGGNGGYMGDNSSGFFDNY
jgi:hypothetical protein